MDLLHEGKKCKAAIYKLWKHKMRIELSYEECDVQQNAASRNEE